MANEFYSSEKGFNWANIGNAAIGAGVSAAASGGVGALFSVGGALLKGLSSSYFGKKSEKRAYRNYLRQLEAEYNYAQRYAENSPVWTVKGLRDAGINPMIAFSSGVPSTPHANGSYSPTSTDVNSDTRFDPLMLKQIQLLDSQIEGQTIKNNNERKNMGLSGRDATYARIFNEVKDLIGPDNFGKLSKSTLNEIKSLFDAPDKYSSLLDFTPPSTRPSIPDSPIVSDDTPPSMAVYTDSRPSRPYYDSRTSRPRASSSGERAIRMNNLRKSHFEGLRRRSKKTFYFDEQFDRLPNLRKHFYR